METTSRYIIFTLLSLAGISCSYFLCLLAGLPVWLPAILSCCVAWLLFQRIVPDKTISVTEPKRTSWLALGIFTCGIAVLTQKAITDASKHGLWDAWAMWNLHARYLTSAEHWRNMFKNVENEHPDYPLGLPSIIAFFSRLTAGASDLLMPFIIGIFTTIATPALIFSEFYKKHLPVASLALFLFVYNVFYIHIGVSQYADPLLSLFFLAAMVCIDHAAEHKKYVALSAALIGCCIWTKNEGMILAILFAVFYADRLFARRYIKMTIAGLALPVLAYILFKSCVTTPNDMISGQGADTWTKITTRFRYQLIAEQFRYNLVDNFHYLKGAFYASLILYVLRRKWPHRQLILVCVCLMAYMLIYVVTPHDLEWHLKTSQNRLMLQLMPAFVYALCLNYSHLKLSGPSRFTFTRMNN